MRQRIQRFLILMLPVLFLTGMMAIQGREAARTAAFLEKEGKPGPMWQVNGSAAIPASADNWGLSFPNEGQSPVGNASVEDLAKYDAYFLGDTGKKVIYLTFDCGYENGFTEQILDALKKHNAPAAFFVVGNMIETAPEIIKRMVDEGHIVGNHTCHHPDMSAISEQAAFQKELDSLAALYKETTGKDLPRFYRPPQGKYSEDNLKQAQALATRRFSGALPMWTGTRTISPPQSRRTASCCPGYTTALSFSCTPHPGPTRTSWTTC